MSERDIILMGGKPGSGKTNLSLRLQSALDRSQDAPSYSVERISLGDYARQQLTLGHGVVKSAYNAAIVDHLNGPDKFKPFDETVAQGMVYERLVDSKADLVLLDGYPRYFSQVDSIFELAVRSGFYVQGAIITHVYEEEAVRRIMKRGDERTISEKDARDRLNHHSRTFHEVVDELKQYIPVTSIDTYHTKERTLIEAHLFVTALLGDRLHSQEAS